MSPPDGPKLRDLLVHKFLGPEFGHFPLEQVAAFASTEASLSEVQDYVGEIFKPFDPAPFHQKIATFVWKAIATTNYDLIVERAYQMESGRQQELVPFFKDGQPVEERLRSARAVEYLKLHGCISNTHDVDCPLILTPEQYLEYETGRQRLFRRLEEYAQECPLLFVGQSLVDSDLRALLLRLRKQVHQAPKSYLVKPGVTEVEKRYWEQNRVTSIDVTFEGFLKALDAAVPSATRTLAKHRKHSQAIERHFATSDPNALSEGLKSFLELQVEHVHGEMPTPDPNPSLFYKGNFLDWSPICHDLDVRRRIADTLISDHILVDGSTNKCDFVVVYGPAGAGKSVLLHRLAWEAATDWEKLVLVMREGGLCDYERVVELYELTRKRIFLFVDNAVVARDALKRILKRARKDNILLTVIATARQNEWYAHCDSLDVFVNTSQELGYLTQKEISQLVELLGKHGSLGRLEALSDAERAAALEARSGRVLLVALHEATLGKPFAEIVGNEYRSIPSPQAQALYRTVCVMHSVGAPARAGLISRVHGVSFSEFGKRFFAPLENVVFSREDKKARDHTYEARHRRIAELVTEQVFPDPQDRLDEYVRIAGALDTDFTADRVALRAISASKTVLDAFPRIETIRSFYGAARKANPNDWHLAQQEAIAEMGHEGGSLEKARTILDEALRRFPKQAALRHSLAELNIKMSQSSTAPLAIERARRDARRQLDLIPTRQRGTHHTHSLLKIHIDELRETLRTGDNVVVAEKVRQIEQSIEKALLNTPGDPYISEIDARLCKILGNNPAELEALRNAFETNVSSAFLALRLARVLRKQGRPEDGASVLKRNLDVNPNDRRVHFELGLLLQEVHGPTAEVIYHFRNSFSPRDQRMEAQFQYARAEFLTGDRGNAREVFSTLSAASVPSRLKREYQGSVPSHRDQRFAGTVEKKEITYGFIVRDGDRESLYARPTSCDCDWDALRVNVRVSFSVDFTYMGPVAVGVRLETA